MFARHRLATRRQQVGESLDEYLLTLKTLSKECNFRAVTATQHCEESIRDAFISGMQSPLIRQRLLENKTLDLATMFDHATMQPARTGGKGTIDWTWEYSTGGRKWRRHSGGKYKAWTWRYFDNKCTGHWMFNLVQFKWDKWLREEQGGTSDGMQWKTWRSPTCLHMGETLPYVYGNPYFCNNPYRGFRMFVVRKACRDYLELRCDSDMLICFLTHFIWIGCNANASWPTKVPQKLPMRVFHIIVKSAGYKSFTVIRCLPGTRTSVYVGKYGNSVHCWIFPSPFPSMNFMENTNVSSLHWMM